MGKQAVKQLKKLQKAELNLGAEINEYLNTMSSLDGDAQFHFVLKPQLLTLLEQLDARVTKERSVSLFKRRKFPLL